MELKKYLEYYRELGKIWTHTSLVPFRPTEETGMEQVEGCADIRVRKR